MRGTRPLTAALLVLACALPAGCGGSGTAADPAPSDAAASPSPSGPVVPALPDAARKHTKAGAVAFVRHYIDLINYAQRSTDYSPLAQLDARECGSCRAARRHFAMLSRQHAVIRGGKWRVEGFFKVFRSGGVMEFSVPAKVTYGAQIVRSAAGTTKYPGGSNVITFFPAWNGTRWELNEWTRAK